MTKEESIQKIDDFIRTMKVAIEDLEEVKKNLSDFDDNLEGLGPIGNLENDYEFLGLQKFPIGFNEGTRYNGIFGRKPTFYTKSFS